MLFPATEDDENIIAYLVEYFERDGRLFVSSLLSRWLNGIKFRFWWEFFQTCAQKTSFRLTRNNSSFKITALSIYNFYKANKNNVNEFLHAYLTSLKTSYYVEVEWMLP